VSEAKTIRRSFGPVCPAWFRFARSGLGRELEKKDRLVPGFLLIVQIKSFRFVSRLDIAAPLT
jgi:hypothetical protein